MSRRHTNIRKLLISIGYCISPFTFGSITDRTNLKELMDTIHLGGPSINSNWHVPRSLHSLEGEIEAAKKVIELWEPYLNYRIAMNKEHPNELGCATVAVMVTAIVAERALKSLIAQTQPNVAPPKKHRLCTLFGQLSSLVQQELQTQFKTLPSVWQEYWEGDCIEKVFHIADNAFVDWRYTMEPKAVTGGIPKGVLKATVAVRMVCLAHLQVWQASLEPSPRAL